MESGGQRESVVRFSVYVRPSALREIDGLPGFVRQRVRRSIEGLVRNARPPGSSALLRLGIGREVRRLRLDKWRIVYAITEEDGIVDVFAVRKRPPYDYHDLDALLSHIR